MKDFKTVKFVDQDFQMNVNISIEEKTIWLSVEQMANLFKKDRSVITRYIKRIYTNNQDEKMQNSCKIAHFQLDDTNEAGRKIKVYNLGIILLVSQYVRSNRGYLLKEFLDKYLSENAQIENEIITYSNGNVQIAVSVSPKEETVWLTANQISMLFETTIDNIYLHIKNIYKEGEILGSVLKDSLITDTPSIGRFCKSPNPARVIFAKLIN